MNQDIYSLQESPNPAGGPPDVVLQYKRGTGPQTIRVRLDDWNTLLLDQVVTWAQTHPQELAGHWRFSDLRKAVELVSSLDT